MKKRLLVVGLIVALSGCGGANVSESLSKGDDALRTGDFRVANIEYTAVLQVEPGNVEARLGMAKVAMAMRNFDGALIELDKARDTLRASGSNTLEVDVLRARSMHAGESTVALLSVPTHNNAEIAYYQVMQYTLKNNLTEARATLTGVPDGDPFYRLATTLIKAFEESPDIALNAFPSLIQGDNVLDSEAALLKADLAFQSRRLDMAIDSMKEYYALNPDDNARGLQFAHLLIGAQQYKEAEPVLNKLVKLFPQHGLINELVAAVAYEMKDYERARSSSSMAIVATPNGIMPRLISAYSANQLGDHQASLTDLEFIIDQLPKDHPAQRLYIKLKADNGDLDGVAERTLELNDLADQDVPMLSTLGLEMMRRGDVSSAKALAERATELGGEGKNVAALGLLQLSLNQTDKAFNTLESAFSSDPSSWVTGNSLATAYLSANRYADAEKLASAWIADGKLIEGEMLSGVIHARQELFVQAQKSFEAVLNQKQDHPAARGGLVEVLVRSNQTQKAESLLLQWVTEPAGLSVFRNYVSASQSVMGEDGLKRAADLITKWINSGIVESDEARYTQAQTLFLSRQFDAAGSALNSVENSYRERAEYWLLRSAVAERQDDNDGSVEAYRAWQKIAPKDPMPLIGEVRALAGQRKIKEAISRLDDALPRFDNTLPGEVLRLQLLMEDGDWERLRKQYHRLPSEVRDTELGKAISGVLDAQSGRYTSAIDKLSGFVQQSGNERYLRWLMVSIEESGTPEQYESVLVNFVSKHENAVAAKFMLGNLHASKSRYPQASVLYQDLVGKGASNPLLFNNYAYVTAKQGDNGLAKELAEKAIKLAPETPAFVETLASILLDLNEGDSAFELMKPLVDKGVNINAKYLETYERAKLAAQQ